MLSIVLPVYNAGGKVEATIRSLKSKLKGLESIMFSSSTGNARSLLKTDQWYEIIVVNDGSVDNTKDVLNKVVDHSTSTRMISYEANMGKGYAIRKGILASRGEFVVFMDGDGEIDSAVLAKYLQGLREADIVIASKYHPDSVVSVPTSRRFLSRCFNVLVKSLVCLNVSDTQVGLKAGRGEAFRRIFESILVKRYAFDVELLAVAQILQLKVIEEPVKIELDAGFRKSEIVRMFLDVLGIAYRLRLSKHYQKNLSPLC
jgi:glycosyltransferase involved in cell wall biosynthesis